MGRRLEDGANCVWLTFFAQLRVNELFRAVFPVARQSVNCEMRVEGAVFATLAVFSHLCGCRHAQLVKLRLQLRSCL